jgi:uncharacterized membrane protein
VGDVLVHIRNKVLAGVLTAVPVGIVIYLALFIEQHTKVLTTPLGFHVPGLGFLIALLGLYVLGLLATSFLGRLGMGLVNRLVQRVPGLNLMFQAWKDVLVVPPDKTGMFHQVVLVPLDGNRYQVGFTSGQPLPGDGERICVLLPDIPSPFSGRLVVVRRDACVAVPVSVEEALKYQLSTGNYLPAGLANRPPLPYARDA